MKGIKNRLLRAFAFWCFGVAFGISLPWFQNHVASMMAVFIGAGFICLGFVHD